MKTYFRDLCELTLEGLVVIDQKRTLLTKLLNGLGILHDPGFKQASFLVDIRVA